jgi:hypothetical protein
MRGVLELFAISVLAGIGSIATAQAAQETRPAPQGAETQDAKALNDVID